MPGPGAGLLGGHEAGAVVTPHCRMPESSRAGLCRAPWMRGDARSVIMTGRASVLLMPAGSDR